MTSKLNFRIRNVLSLGALGTLALATTALAQQPSASATAPQVHQAEVAGASAVAARVAEGKKVYELQPDVDWDKGRAVLWLIETLKLEEAMPVYIGDDVTDEDAFRALAGRGLGIAVQDAPRPTAATLTLRDPEEVRALLARL